VTIFNVYRKFHKVWTSVVLRFVSEKTNTLITILCALNGGAVNREMTVSY